MFADDIVLYRSADFTEAPATSEPLYAREHGALLEQCRAALDRRREAYPEMIAARKIGKDLAARDIKAWELLVQEWCWIVEGEGTPPPSDTLSERIAACTLALQRIDEQLERGNRGHDILRQSHLVEALRWHLVNIRHGAPAIHFWTQLTRDIRGDLAEKRSAAA